MLTWVLQQGKLHSKRRLSRKDEAMFKTHDCKPKLPLPKESKKPQDGFYPQNSHQDDIMYCLPLNLWVLLQPSPWRGQQQRQPHSAHPHHGDKTGFTMVVVQGVFSTFLSYYVFLSNSFHYKGRRVGKIYLSCRSRSG